MAPTGGEQCDFDLHGLVGIRVLGAKPPDLAAVRSQLGPIERPLSREPDIVIRFVERLPLRSPLRLLGARDAGFTNDAFLILRSRHKTPAAVEIPFEAIGGRLEIRCERDLAAVPLLIPIINLAVVARGGLPLHASAFRHGNRGVLAPGWAKGGKTELLLAFAAEGAEYVGDEWIYLDRGGDRMSGIPEPIRVWDWHLTELPALRRRLRTRQRIRLATLRRAAFWMGRVGGSGRRSSRGWRGSVRRLAHLIHRQRFVHIPPRQAFEGDRVPRRSPLDVLFFVACHEAPETVVEPVAPSEVAERMAVSLQEERSELMSYYRHFRFAFPDRRNRLIDSVEEIERQRLHDFLQGRRSYLVLHPYPPSLPALFAAVRPFITGLDAPAPAPGMPARARREPASARGKPAPASLGSRAGLRRGEAGGSVKEGGARS